MNTGIYYNNITKEITSVTNSDLPSEAGWRQLTDDPQLGLLAVRALLVDRGLVDEDTTVYWHLPQPDQAGGPALVCAQTETEKKTGGRPSRGSTSPQSACPRIASAVSSRFICAGLSPLGHPA